MKRILVVLMMAILIAGCKEKQKVYYESDVKEDENLVNSVDYISLYVRCHELDSIRDVAVTAARKGGIPLQALPDSVGQIWDVMMKMILTRQGERAFGLYETHKQTIADYLRLDFLNYGFITQVYLPYEATVKTKEEYGDICIKELEKEFIKAQQQLMMGMDIPSHYENMLMDLFYAYANNNRNDEALALCEEILAFIRANYGEESANYATMLNNKANLCNNMGSSYSAMIAAKQAIRIYDKCIAEGGDEQRIQTLEEEKKNLEEKLKLWQGE